MSRSGYTYEMDDQLVYGRYRGQVSSAIRGRRGQMFLQELGSVMDSMEEKVLIRNELIDENGDCCPIGVICKSRGLDINNVNYEEPKEVGALVDIAKCMAAEIAYENDEEGYNETPEDLWRRMRRWVSSNIAKEK